MTKVTYKEYEELLIHTCEAYGFGEEDTLDTILPISHTPEKFGLMMKATNKIYTAEMLQNALECIKELNDREMIVTK